MANPVFAAPRFSPGQTLNPGCSPTDPDCAVANILTIGANATFTNATMTNATSTGSFYTPLLSALSATLTNIYTNLIIAVSGIFTNLTATNANFTNATTTNATTTNLAVTNALTVSGLGNGLLFAGTNGTVSATSTLSLTNGGTGATTVAGAQSALGLSYATTTDFNYWQMALWGDSLTLGLSRILNSLPFTNYEMYYGGVGGQDSTQIANRMVAYPSASSSLVIIWAGRNNFSATTTVEADIDRMVASLATPKRFIILSVINGSNAGEGVGGAGYNNIIIINNYIASHYPNNYLDIRSYLVSQYNPNIPQDVIDHTNDTVPSSLRVDTIHLTNAGYQLVANQLANFINNNIQSNPTSRVLSYANIPQIGLGISNVNNLNILDGSSLRYNNQQIFIASTTLGNYFAAGAGNLITTGANTTGFGGGSLSALTTGAMNTAFGSSVLAYNTTGSNNVAMGYYAGLNNLSGSNNIFIGNSAGNNSISSSNSVFIGHQSGYYATSTQYNTFVGFNSGMGSNASYQFGDRNTALGYTTLLRLTSGSQNVAVGYAALGADTSGTGNVAVGDNALNSNTTGATNNAIGVFALQNNLTGSNNIAIGGWAMRYSTSSIQNVAIGDSSLANNSQGSGANVSIGYQAGYSNVLGSNSVYVGYQAGYRINPSDWSSALSTLVGYQAGYNSVDVRNTFVGYQSGLGSATVVNGGGNTAFGHQTLMSNGTGSNNTVIGYTALNYNNTGIGNFAGGYSAGTGSGNFRSVSDNYMTFLGYGASRDSLIASTTGLTNGTAIGKNARVGGSNMLVLGATGTDAVLVGIGTSTPDSYLNVFGSSSVPNLLHVATSTNQNILLVTNTGSLGLGTSTPAFKFQVYLDSTHEGHVDANGNWAQTSDATLKKNIITLPNALDDIMKLRGVKYDWQADTNATGSSNIGFIAQEVEQVFPQFVDEGSNGIKGVAYGAFTPVLLQAIKEIQTEILGLAQSITTQVITAITGHFNNLCLKKSDGSDVCVTGDQLNAFLNGSGQSATAPIIDSTPAVDNSSSTSSGDISTTTPSTDTSATSTLSANDQ